MSTKVLIVDDHELVRYGLGLLLKRNEMEVIGEAADGRQAVEMVSKLKPDIVLMDVAMPNFNGIDATKKIKDEYPNVKIIALSAYYSKGFLEGMLGAGASGYILKECAADELIRGIQTVVDGGEYLSPKVTKVVVDEYIIDSRSYSDVPLAAQLTLKERELIQLLTENKSNKEAAKLLHVSIKTVDARRRIAMEKLGITGIADLTKFAIREGLTTLDS
ncbi:MAG TPA: response regulator transcription factor [Sedimentisphaerales bacterium]|nr:response regulator transcription factor [Sedimentisphaerales bacterium]